MSCKQVTFKHTFSTRMSAFSLSLVFLLGLVTYGICASIKHRNQDGDCLLDVAILADISKSMVKENLEQLAKIFDRVVGKLGVSSTGSHVALVTFGPNATVINTFAEKRYYNATTLKEKAREATVQSPSSVKRQGTRTDLAMNLAVTKVFTKKGGDRANVSNVMIVLTDGKTWIDSRWDNRAEINLSSSTEALERKNVKIFVVGIGNNAKQDNAQAKMNKTAGKKGEVFLYSDFSDFSNELDDFMTKDVCAPPTKPPATTPPAPIDGGYTEWSESECSVTCGGGMMTRTRTCTNPPPSDGGKDCTRFGSANTTVSCNPQECPAHIDGGYTKWSESECSVTCGGGMMTLTRTCTNPPPSDGGKDCTRFGSANTTVSCNSQECPVCPVDLAFIMDSSNSITRGDYSDEKELVKRIVTDLKVAPDESRVAFVLFGSEASVKVRFGDNRTANEFIDVVQKLHKSNSRTRIDKALRVAANEVFPDARHDVYKIAVVLTDGKQSAEASGLLQASKPLRNASDRVIAVGMGDYRQKRLRLMTDRREDVVKKDDAHRHLKRILKELNQNDCTRPTKPPAEGQPDWCEEDPKHECSKHGYSKKPSGEPNPCSYYPDYAAANCPISCGLCQPLSAGPNW